MADQFIVPTRGQRLVAVLKVVIPLALLFTYVAVVRSFEDPGPCATACDWLPQLRLHFATGSVVLIFLVGAWSRVGWRSWSSGQWPAPGTALLFRQRIHTGWFARANAIAMFVGAIALACLLVLFLDFFLSEGGWRLLLGLADCAS